MGMYVELDLWLLIDLFVFGYGLDWIDFIVGAWSVVTISVVLYASGNHVATQTLLYVFGVYRTLLANFAGVMGLLYSNFVVGVRFLIYNLVDLFKFQVVNQIWTPLFRRGAYLTLLNASRTRWQLTKSHNLNKNK